MLRWLEQEKNPSEETGDGILRLPHIQCSASQKTSLEEMAESRSLGIWRIKRAKVILGALEGKSLERLILDVRVPPETIVKCLRAFSRDGLQSLQHPTRKPTQREARVEKMLNMLEDPSGQKGRDWKRFSLRYLGIHFTGAMILKIRALIRANPDAKRAELAKALCREFGFFSPTGKTKQPRLGEILKRMDMDNIVRVPKGHASTVQARIRDHKPRLVTAGKNPVWHHRELEHLSFTLIQGGHHQQLWIEIMGCYHYLKRPWLVGPQLRYLIQAGKPDRDSMASQQEHSTLIGGIGFSQGSWRLASREAFIGWDDGQRERNLNRVITNSRFLILPWIQCPNLASKILGSIAKRVCSDWEALYGVQPVLLETFVQEDRFSGTCYRAANWIQVGRTEGYSYFSGQRERMAPKLIFLYPLCKNFREILCHSPEPLR